MNALKRLGMVAVAGAVMAVPAVSEAHHRAGHTQGPNPGGGICTTKPDVNKGYVVTGTLVSGGYTPDNPTTPMVNETSVAITVKNANRHARVSGELDDQNATKAGVQVKGDSYTVNSSGTPADLFTVKLSGYEAMESPGTGDKVRIAGKVAVKRKRCAPAGTSVADRYGAVNVKRVRIIDAD